MGRTRIIAVVVGLLLLILWWTPWDRGDVEHKILDLQAGSPPQSSAKSPPVEILPRIQERVPAESADATVSRSEATKQIELRGYVTWRVNGKPVAGVRVVAFVSDEVPPTAEEVMSLAAGTQLLASSESDSHGHFAILGLNPSRKYDLIAGAPGIIVPDLVERVMPGESEVTVPVLHAHGALIQFVTDGKEQFEYPQEQRRSIHYEITFADEAAEDVSTFPPAVALAGVPLDSLLESAERILILTGFEEGPTTTDPNSIKVSAPGYESKDENFVFSRLDQGLAKTVMPLVKLCSGYGDVECIPIGIGAVLQGSLASRQLKMVLEAQDASGRLDTFPFEFSSAKPVTIRGLPLGELPVRAFLVDARISFNPFFSFPFAGDSAVGETPLKLEINFSHSGLLSFACKTAAGVEPPAMLEIQLSNVDALKAGLTKNRVMSQVMRIKTTDGLVGPLNSGEYTAMFLGSGQKQSIAVRDGEITKVTFEYGVR